MIQILAVLAVCCGATILLEMLPLLLVSQRKNWLKASIVCNVATNPVLNMFMLVVYLLTDHALWSISILFVLEVAVVFFEAFVYHKMLSKKYLPCFLFSLVANAISFLGSIPLAPLLETFY